jgi:hypothetical protein
MWRTKWRFRLKILLKYVKTYHKIDLKNNIFAENRQKLAKIARNIYHNMIT